ncbi:hypothetical protein Aperf_G00000125163 [Anoplocephala perfoliata]
MSGGIFHGPSTNKSYTFKCDQIIRSKFSPYFEPLWLTNQRHGMKSGTFYWPDDFVAVNKSHPYLSAGSNPTGRNPYFDIEKIYQWLFDPSITFLSIFIPPPPNSRRENFIFNYVEYTDSFLSTLFSYIRKSPILNASVSIVFVGGTAAVNAETSFDVVLIREMFQQWPSSVFGGHFNQGPILEIWPTTDELDEENVQRLIKRNPSFFACSTEEFRERNPDLDVGLLPPYYLVAKSEKTLVVDLEIASQDPRATRGRQSGAFILLWGKAFTTSSDVCGGSHAAPSIELFDIYPLVCWALGLQQPWLNQGNLSRVSRYFKNPPSDAEVAEFESRTRDWSKGSESGKFAFTKVTLISGGIIAALAITLALTFIICAVKYNCRYKSFELIDGSDGIRYRKRRFRRPWLASSSRSLLGNHEDNAVRDESEEDEVLMANDAFSARENRKLRKENADSFIQMLHSPPDSSARPIRNTPSSARA